MAIGRFKDLKSWQEARKLNERVGRLVDKRTSARNWRLAWQLEEAAASTMSNIAEAHGRYSFEDRRGILDIAMGSCKEVQSRLDAALDRRGSERGEFDAAYSQADGVSQRWSGTLQNFDGQIRKPAGIKSPVRRKPEDWVSGALGPTGVGPC